MAIRCIIVEDEPLAMGRIKDYIGKVPFLKLLNAFDSPLEAIEFLGSTKVELIFLDIQMDGLSGIQFLESLSWRPEVIITTAFDKYALKGFELSVSDYLLKPYTFERFIQAVSRVNDKLNSKHLIDSAAYLFIKTEYHLEKIFLNDILFIVGMGDYRQLHTNQKKIMTLSTFTELENSLPAASFCRVHKSYMVSIDKIESIERDRIRIKNELIPVSETYKETFYKLIDYPKK